MPSEKKGRHIFRFDGESLPDILTSGIEEDDYGEESMGPGKKKDHRPSPNEDYARWKKRLKEENKKGGDIGDAEK